MDETPATPASPSTSFAARRIQRPVAAAVAVGAIGGWIAAVWAHWHGWLPLWALIATAVALIAAIVALHRFAARGAERADALSPWREYRVVQTLQLHWTQPKGYSLTLGLCREADGLGPTVTLRFHEVAGLAVQQLANWPVHGVLLCDDRGTERRDGMRYKVYDRHGEGCQFTCRSFEVLLG